MKSISICYKVYFNKFALILLLLILGSCIDFALKIITQGLSPLFIIIIVFLVILNIKLIKLTSTSECINMGVKEICVVRKNLIFKTNKSYSIIGEAKYKEEGFNRYFENLKLFNFEEVWRNLFFTRTLGKIQIPTNKGILSICYTKEIKKVNLIMDFINHDDR